MTQKITTVNIASGLEARSVALFVQVASKFKSSVYVEAREKRVNAKSIMGMMSLGVIEGEEITIIVDGADEEEALQELEKYLAEGEE